MAQKQLTSIDMNGNAVTNLPTTPSGSNDAASKSYVETRIANVVEDTTPQLGGNLDTQTFTVDGRDVGTDGTKLDTIATNADVTNATNVDSAGAVMNTDASTASMSFVIDEDAMTSNSDTKVPTQQSVKAYVDANAGGTTADNSITNAKLADVATNTLKGRVTALTGDPEDLTPAQVRTLLNVADGATANSSDATLLTRANHTGTQAVSTLTGILTSAQGGTGNGFFTVAGPATTAKTYTFPNANATILTSATAVSVAQGGTGRATGTTAYGLVAVGTTATGAQQTIAPGTSGQFLKSAGTTALASFSAIAQSDVTNLVTDLAGKQATLVSGTNIKTVNGTTLLGSGDVVISGGVSDGDKGDITVSASGATWTIDNAVVTNAKLANMTQSTIKGRVTASTGAPEDLTASQVRTIINVADGATANSSDATLLARANHTGTQTASTISDIQTTITNNTQVLANTAKVTNATHTGDATGSTALTLATVNVNTGSFGGATSVPAISVNGKGLITGVTATSIQIPQSQVTNLTTDLSGKQATLVSGTNIKTVNSTSILGSGDIAVSATPAGSTTQVQYNNAGALGASAGLTYDSVGGNNLWLGTGLSSDTSADGALVLTAYTATGTANSYLFGSFASSGNRTYALPDITAESGTVLVANNATQTLTEKNLASSTNTVAFRRIIHGATAGTARPNATHVEWIGSVTPTNANTTLDTWIDTA